MRVLTVGNLYPPHHLGGYELVWQEAVAHLRERGHEVRVLATDFRRPSVGSADDRGRIDDVHRELEWYWRDHGWPWISPPGRLRLERRNSATLERHLDDFRPDVVGWWAMGGMSLSLIERVRRLGTPAAGFVCDGWLVYGPKVDGWLRLASRPLIAPVVERLSGIPTRVRFAEVGPWLFPSEVLRSEAAERRGLRDTEVAHQGVDRAVFAPAERPPWRWRLLYAGRIDPRKGIDLAVRALAHLPADSRLDIVGDGDSEHLGELRSLAEREGVSDRVGFHPAESRNRLRSWYSEADALVFPVVWQEPWGLVPLEAMAVGTPVIASGRGGSGEYLRPGRNCVLFEPDDGPGALADAVWTLARDPELRERLRSGGSATSAGIEPEGFSRAVEATLVRAVGARSS